MAVHSVDYYSCHDDAEFGNVNSFFPYSRQHAPSSHLFSNVDDMSRFALAHVNQGQLGEARILLRLYYGT